MPAAPDPWGHASSPATGGCSHPAPDWPVPAGPRSSATAPAPRGRRSTPSRSRTSATRAAATSTSRGCGWSTAGSSSTPPPRPGRGAPSTRQPLDLDAGAAVGDAAAPVGERVVGERVGGALAVVLPGPPAERHGDDTGAQPRAHAGREGEGPPVVPDAHGVALGDAPRGGVDGVELDERSALRRAVLGEVRVRRVEEPG